MKRRKMKQVLVVGSGDVARRIIPWLARRFRVCAVVRRPEERAALRADYEARYVAFVSGLRAAHPAAHILLWATDLADGSGVLFRSGDTGTAVRASSAVPAVFQP